ncbi:hypothetical protein BgiBS90_004810, partial [Biomphalaria glabrata]
TILTLGASHSLSKHMDFSNPDSSSVFASGLKLSNNENDFLATPSSFQHFEKL